MAEGMLDDLSKMSPPLLEAMPDIAEPAQHMVLLDSELDRAVDMLRDIMHAETDMDHAAHAVIDNIGGGGGASGGEGHASAEGDGATDAVIQAQPADDDANQRAINAARDATAQAQQAQQVQQAQTVAEVSTTVDPQHDHDSVTSTHDDHSTAAHDTHETHDDHADDHTDETVDASTHVEPTPETHDASTDGSATHTDS